MLSLKQTAIERYPSADTSLSFKLSDVHLNQCFHSKWLHNAHEWLSQSSGYHVEWIAMISIVYFLILVAFQNKLLTWSLLRDNIASLKPCIVYVTIKPQLRRSTLWAPSKYLKLQGLSHKSTLKCCITMPLQANAHLKTKPRNTHKPCHQKYKYITTKHTNIKPGDTQIQNQEPHKYIEAKLRWYIGVWEAVQGNTCGQLHLLACPTRQTLQQPPSTKMKRQCSQIQIQTDIQIQLIS